MSGQEPLARDRFALPEGMIYLDGNSLGALPTATPARLQEVAARQWGEDLISSWTKHDWIDWAETVAAKLAPIVCARADELIVADSTSVTLFKLLGAAVAARPDRKVVLTVETNFPTDLYVAQGLCDLLGLELRRVPFDAVAGAIDESVAAVTLTHVDYRGGGIHDMAVVNAAATAAGALTVWDLSHSAGAIALDLNGSGADLAVGCGYKYLNGGPGAPAFAFVAKRLQGELVPPVRGWMGHAEPFAFAPDFMPAGGIRRFASGTPPILALAALECGLDTFAGFAMNEIEAASKRLSQRFIDEVAARCGDELRLVSSADPAKRGGHVCFAHEHGYELVQALIAREVIGDFRAPHLLRFGFTPLYLGEADVVRATTILGDIVDSRAWDDPRFHARAKVT